MDIIIVHQGTLVTLRRQLFIVELDGVIITAGITITITITGRAIIRCTFIQKATDAAVVAVAATRALPMQVLVVAMIAFGDAVILVARIPPWETRPVDPAETILMMHRIFS